MTITVPPLNGSVVDATPAGPGPLTVCAVRLQQVVGVVPFGAVKFTVTVTRSAKKSGFHHEKCDTSARSARPVPLREATMSPSPSCVHWPVVSFSDHTGIRSPTAIVRPSGQRVAYSGISMVARRPLAICNGWPFCVSSNSTGP